MSAENTFVLIVKQLHSMPDFLETWQQKLVAVQGDYDVLSNLVKAVARYLSSAINEHGRQTG